MQEDDDKKLIDFCENILGLKLFPYQKAMLKEAFETKVCKHKAKNARYGNKANMIICDECAFSDKGGI